MELTNFNSIAGHPDSTVAREYAAKLISTARFPAQFILPGKVEEKLTGSIRAIDLWLEHFNSAGCTWSEFVAGCNHVAAKNRKLLTFVLERCEYKNPQFMMFFAHGMELAARCSKTEADAMVDLAISVDGAIEQLKVEVIPLTVKVDKDIEEMSAIVAGTSDERVIEAGERMVTKMLMTKARLNQQIQLVELFGEYATAAAQLFQIIERG